MSALPDYLGSPIKLAGNLGPLLIFGKRHAFFNHPSPPPKIFWVYML